MLRNISIVTIAASLACAGSPCVTASPQQAGNKPSEPAKSTTRNVAIVVHEGVELLDFAGPGEVFAAAARRGAPAGKPWFNVYTVAPKTGTITAQGYVKIEPQYTIDNCPKPDILVIPGGDTSVLLDDSKFMAWVRDNAASREISLSVCTGAFVLAKAGLLDGKEATTHWGSIDGLRTEAPSATVREGVRFVDNGAVITSAGVSAGIDGSLHVVGRLLGRSAAEQTAKYMEYEWRPDPKVLASYPEFSASLDERGRAFAKADALRQKETWPEAIKAYEALTKQYPDDGNAWYLLGYCLHASGDIDRAIEIHAKAATFETRRERPLYNLACAYALKGDAEKAFATLDQAIAAGWNNPGYLANDTDWKALKDDPRFKAVVKRMSAGQSDQ